MYSHTRVESSRVVKYTAARDELCLWPLADICEHFWRILHVPLDAGGRKGTQAIRQRGNFPMMGNMTSLERIRRWFEGSNIRVGGGRQTARGSWGWVTTRVSTRSLLWPALPPLEWSFCVLHALLTVISTAHTWIETIGALFWRRNLRLSFCGCVYRNWLTRPLRCDVWNAYCEWWSYLDEVG